jgi:hypothetical protein
MKTILNKLYRLLLRDDLLIAVLFFIAFKVSGAVLFLDPDVAWHIKAGEQIINTFSIPNYDSWSFVGREQKWYNISWLWDVLIAFSHNFLGLDDLHTFSCVLHVLLLVCLYHSLKIWAGDSPEALLISTSIAGVVLLDTMLLRPQLASYYLILATFTSLKAYKLTLNKKYLYLIPFIIMLWANMHGSFILGLGIICVYILEAILEKNFAQFKNLISTLVISLAATLINPYTADIYYAVARTLNSEIYKHIAEWGQFVFGRAYGASLIVLLFIFFNLFPKEIKKIGIAETIITYSCLIASLFSIRYFGILAILSPSFIAQRIKHLVKETKGTHQHIFNYARLGFISIGILFSLYLVMYGEAKKYNENQIPLEEIAFIKANYPGLNFFNNYNVGGYIIYFANGTFKHFIDGRAGTVFTEKILIEYLKYKTLTYGWTELFQKYPFHGALVSHQDLKEMSVNTYFNSWKEVYSGKYGKVFLRL